MRELICRAKTQGAGEWVYGYYCKYGKHIHKIHTIDNDGNAVVQCSIDIVTLCEYTNLKDKNGKMIFEDDIVTSNGKPLRVRLNDFQWGMFTTDNKFIHRLEKEDSEIFEVIGNIYDNPELLN